MLTIRLARTGRKKLPLYRIVLTEHTKPIQTGYQDVLGYYDPIKKTVECDMEKITHWIGKGSQMSSRAAKVIHKATGNDVVKPFIVITERTRTKKKED
jgi:small subunit ribosomal protein S16